LFDRLIETYVNFASEFDRGHVPVASCLGPPIPVYRYTEYRDTALNVGGIDTGFVPRNTVASGINNFTSQQSPLSTLWLFV